MSAVASSVIRQQPGGARGSGWVCISVPSLSRLAAIELLSTKNSLSLSETTQEALKLVSSGDSSSNVKALKIWVDTEGLDWLMTKKKIRLNTVKPPCPTVFPVKLTIHCSKSSSGLRAMKLQRFASSSMRPIHLSSQRTSLKAI